MKSEQISIGILAGGKSSRMGKNKALLPWNNSTMIEKLISGFSDFSQIMISVGNMSEFSDSNLFERKDILWVEDERKEYGPLEGVYQLLTNSQNDWMFVVATDMPFVTSSFVKTLCSNAADCQAVIPRTDGKIHPLCGLYNKKALKKIEELFSSDEHRMRILLEGLDVKYVELNADEAYAVANINTPEEYKKILLF